MADSAAANARPWRVLRKRKKPPRANKSLTPASASFILTAIHLLLEEQSEFILTPDLLMATLVAFIFALALACVAGMEYVYLKFFEAQNRQLKRRVKELERENAELSGQLQHAEELLEEFRDESEESWPELIDDN